MVQSCAEQWKEKYTEIDSLFYFLENDVRFNNIELVSLRILKNYQAFDMITESMLLNFKSLGLIFYNLDEFIVLGIRKGNVPFLDFLYKQRLEGLKNGTYEVEGNIKDFIPNLIRHSVYHSNIKIFKPILGWNDKQKNLSQNKALGYGLGYPITYDSSEIIRYISEKKDYTKILNELASILESSNSEFKICTKMATLGEYETIKKEINSEFKKQLSLNLKEKSSKKLIKI